MFLFVIWPSSFKISVLETILVTSWVHVYLLKFSLLFALLFVCWLVSLQNFAWAPLGVTIDFDCVYGWLGLRLFSLDGVVLVLSRHACRLFGSCARSCMFPCVQSLVAPCTVLLGRGTSWRLWRLQYVIDIIDVVRQVCICGAFSVMTLRVRRHSR